MRLQAVTIRELRAIMLGEMPRCPDLSRNWAEWQCRNNFPLTHQNLSSGHIAWFAWQKKYPNCQRWYAPALQSYTSWRVRSTIITISKVTFAKSCRVVQCTGAVAEELFCKQCIIAVAVCLCKTFFGDTTISNRLSHHPLGKYELILLVEVCLK